MTHHIAVVLEKNSQEPKRATEIKNAIEELGHQVVTEEATWRESDAVVSFDTTRPTLPNKVFPVEQLSMELPQFCETYQYDYLTEEQALDTGMKVVTAYSFYEHIYPLIIHGPPWRLEVELDRKEALKLRYMLSKYQSHFKKESLIEYQVAISEKRDVFLLGINFNPLVEADERLELAINRSGVYWVDLVEQAIAPKLSVSK